MHIVLHSHVLGVAILRTESCAFFNAANVLIADPVEGTTVLGCFTATTVERVLASCLHGLRLGGVALDVEDALALEVVVVVVVEPGGGGGGIVGVPFLGPMRASRRCCSL